MYLESSDLQDLFSEIDDHQMAGLAQEKGNDALQPDYAEDAKSIVDGFQKRITKVWNQLIVGIVLLAMISGGSWYILENTVLTVVSASLSVLFATVFPFWKMLIEHDQAAHQVFNKTLVPAHGNVFGEKRKREHSFAILYWNSILIYKVGLIGLIALAILDFWHTKILRGKFRDPLKEQMIMAGRNWNDILEEEGIIERVKLLRQDSKPPEKSRAK